MSTVQQQAWVYSVPMQTVSVMGRKGFTIVELLVVIVVIAILAAITVVSYNGIRASAEKSQTLMTVRAFVQALQSYQVGEGGASNHRYLLFRRGLHRPYG